jgi:nucleoside-diphosphate-sugar epimerase
MSAPLAVVTGATGWLGKRLVRALAEGLPEVPGLAQAPERKIRCLVLPGEDSSALRAISGRVEIVEGNVSDAQSVDRFMQGAEDATVFHVAGMIHPNRFVREFYDVNEKGTQHIVAAAKQAKARRLIYVSSNSPIGCNPDATHVFDESSPYNPYMNYGRSKMLAEEIVKGASRDLETVIVRAPWFYGPGQPPRQSLFFTMVKEGKAPLLGDGSNRRSMSYVDNLCQGLLLCEQVDTAKGQVYWIADRRPYPMSEVLDTIERVIEKDFGMTVAHKRMRLPNLVGDVAFVVDKLVQGVGLYHQKFHVLSEMNKTIACSIAKAERELGYDPKIELQEGMRRSIQSLVEQGVKI